MPSPFEVEIEELRDDLDSFVDQVFESLQSQFLIMPKGPGFIEYPVFENGYETLKQATEGFKKFSPSLIVESVYREPIALIVLRTMLGFTPPEWAYLASERGETKIPQRAVRSIDRKFRLNAGKTLRNAKGLTDKRVHALVNTACELLKEGAPDNPAEFLHRLDKADTKSGVSSIQALAGMGVPYAVLLYERFLGRPFATHKDSVSEIIGDLMEIPIEKELDRHGVSYRKTKKAEKIEGFDQAPDFIVPSEFNPKVVIEAKLAEDDGTARDKVTRLQHLAALSMDGQTGSEPRFEFIACIDGRGFAERREDMKKLLIATRGKVFTLKDMGKLVANTGLKTFKTAKQS